MKKKIWFVFLIGLLLNISSCGMEQNSGAVDTKQETNVQEEEKQKTETGETDKNNQKPEEEQEPMGDSNDLLQSQGTKQVDIYSSNDEATELVTTSVNLEDLTAQALLGELSRKGILPESVKVNVCKKVEYESKDAIELDLSDDFTSYLNTQGTTGELITMASLSNTFLKAYGCEAIHITIEGKVLASSHAEYPGYMGFFENIR